MTLLTHAHKHPRPTKQWPYSHTHTNIQGRQSNDRTHTRTRISRADKAMTLEEAIPPSSLRTLIPPPPSWKPHGRRPSALSTTQATWYVVLANHAHTLNKESHTNTHLRKTAQEAAKIKDGIKQGKPRGHVPQKNCTRGREKERRHPLGASYHASNLWLVVCDCVVLV